MTVDPSNFDYVMYVDASGDDGFQFDNGSSACYAAAAFLVKQEDISHNLDILMRIKKLVGCKETDEVKYSKVRRNRRGPEALALLKDLKGSVSCHVTFKKEFSPSERPSPDSKDISVICHLMALYALTNYSFLDDHKILVAIDRMKHTEEVPIDSYMKHGFPVNPDKAAPKYTSRTIFRDSKDKNFLLIQIADLLCGIIREHFEQYETNPDMVYFRSKCPNCQLLQMAKPSFTRPLCQNGKSRASRIVCSKNLGNIYQLIPERDSPRMMDYFFMDPVHMVHQHFYHFCKKI